jgi:N-acetylmuramoyl-L-alanine amidase
MQFKNYNLKRITVLPLVLLLVFLFSSFHEYKIGKGIKTVVIDAGHGGKDPGCNGASHNEKQVTLAIALKLGKLIEEKLKDVKVIYTRTTDVFVELEERAQIANRNNADLFISIHCNAAAKYVTYKDKNGKTQYKTWKDKKGKVHRKETVNPIPYGSETYVMGLKNEKGKMQVAKRENASMLLEDNYEKTYNGFDPNSDEAYIIMSITTSAFVEQSAKFASYIQKEYKEKAGRIDKGVHRQSIWVLWRTAMPSILTEVGFLTNPIEEEFLGSDKGQTYLASSIFRALRNYKNEIENTNHSFNDEIDKLEPLENENKIFEREHPELINREENDKPENETNITPVADNDENYKTLIKQADEKLKERKLQEAKSIYQEALKIKSNDIYCKEKLIEIEKLDMEILKSEKEKQLATEEQSKLYQKQIKEADDLFIQQKYVLAKQKYQDALITKPGERYPKIKINDISELEKKPIEPKDTTKKITANDIIKNYNKTKKDSGAVIKQNEINDISFKVQFASFEKEIPTNSDYFKNAEQVWSYKMGAIFKYTSGNFKKLEEAIQHQSKLKNKGYKDAFVVAFKNNTRIDIKEALKILEVGK